MGSKGISRREFLGSSGAAAGLTFGPGLSRAHGASLSSVARHSKHVLLISVDGLHAVDLDRYVAANPSSALAKLGQKGYTYTQASTSTPSDSFPGLLALITGGSPRSTGIWYDVAFDRTLLPPGGVGGPGTVTTYDESIDIDMDRLDGGSTPANVYKVSPGQGINPAALAVDPITHNPLMPWQLLRVNTIFEVAKAEGRRTAWADKHVGAYQIVHGPSGHGVDDYFSPEINSLAAQLEGGLPAGDQFKDSHVAIKLYDSLKVKAVVHQCNGLDSLGADYVGTPAIFGMNFQTISVAQKLASEIDSALLGGYTDSDGTPNTAISAGMDFVDGAIGQMVAALTDHGILDKTTIIITAKHAQSPINMKKRRVVPDGGFDDAIAPVVGAGNYAVTADDVALIWLKSGTPQSLTSAVVSALWASTELNDLPADPAPPSGTPLGLLPWPANPGIEDILWGETLKLRFNDPLADPRTPDIIVLPTPGIIYAGKKSKKLSEHGGFCHDDTNAALLISNPGLKKKTIKAPVQTAQVAPTILKLLSMDPGSLQAVQQEKTDELPALDS